MIRGFLYLIAALALPAAPARSATVAFDFALVGNPGNSPDIRTGLGAVASTYAISKTEVTNTQYAAFLNSVDPAGENALELYNPSMAGNRSGIANSGSSNGSRYVALPGQQQKPVTYVSFFDAMRFANWLHNGQGAGDTETGVYTIGTGIDEVRSPDARYWIPNEDEWYKAAYHDATVGKAGVYFDYATGSNEEPISDSPEDNPAAVNYANDDGLDNGFNDGYAVWNDSPFPSTDVGAYTEAASSYGTFDQNGNVSEWNESLRRSSLRVLRGAYWASNLSFLSATLGGGGDIPLRESGLRGFRIATVPEPSAAGILAIMCFGLCVTGQYRQPAS